MKTIRNRGLIGAGIAASVAAFGILATGVSGTAIQPSAAGSEAKSQGVKAGDKAPDFTLTDLQGKTHNLKDYLDDGKTVVLEWFNPGCPFVKKHHKNTDSMTKTYDFAKEHDVVWLAINSGAPGEQGHGVERNKLAKKDFGIEYPILIDETGKVGKAFGAKTTPHMFVISPKGTVVYQGAIDNDRSIRSLGETNYVLSTLKRSMAGETIEVQNSRPYGCSIKYAH